MPFFDIHTHHSSSYPDYAIRTCFSDNDLLHVNTGFLSVGIHPWHLTEEGISRHLQWINHAISHPNVVAIGECGLDRKREVPIHLQLEAFKYCVELSEAHSLPLIIHAVKCSEQLYSVQKQYHPRMPWVIHGFRGKKELASDYLNHGFYLSFGEHFNEDALRCTPLERMFFETDDCVLPIENIYREAASVCGISVELLNKQVLSNVQKVLFVR